MRALLSLRRGPRLASVVMLATLALAITLAGCGGSTSATSTTGPGTPIVTGATATTGAATTGAASTVTASTSLCDLMSLGDMSAVLGGTVGTITRVKTSSGGSTAVNCTYLPSGAAVDAEISYLFTSNGQTAYAANKADDASRGETETTLSGLGDAAFWAISSAHKNVLQVTVLKGNVLLVMTLGGAGADGSTMVNGAVGLAKKALPSL